MSGSSYANAGNPTNPNDQLFASHQPAGLFYVDKQGAIASAIEGGAIALLRMVRAIASVVEDG